MHAPAHPRAQIYCVCRKPNDGSQYFGCERCEGWFHAGCLGINDEDVINGLVKVHRHTHAQPQLRTHTQPQPQPRIHNHNHPQNHPQPHTCRPITYAHVRAYTHTTTPSHPPQQNALDLVCPDCHPSNCVKVRGWVVGGWVDA